MYKNKKLKIMAHKEGHTGFSTNFTDAAMGGTGSGFLFGQGGFRQARKDFESEYGMTPRKYKKSIWWFTRRWIFTR